MIFSKLQMASLIVGLVVALICQSAYYLAVSASDFAEARARIERLESLAHPPKGATWDEFTD